MSETLPPITGTGVTIQFIFPFDRALPREAKIVWRRPVGDTQYAAVTQSGDSCVVHEQVTFPGDAWAVVDNSGNLLLLHVATGEREQRVLINAESKRRGAGEQSQPPLPPPPQQTAAEDDEEAELARAIAESLQTAAAEAAPVSACAAASSSTTANATAASSSSSAAASNSVGGDEDDPQLREALALSKRLADEHRQRSTGAKAANNSGLSSRAASKQAVTTASPPTATPEPVMDADAMRQARLRRFGGS
jgi:hypothetical protein